MHTPALVHLPPPFVTYSLPLVTPSRDPSWFPLILTFLRDGRVALPESALERAALRQEAEFYALTELVAAIDDAEAAAADAAAAAAADQARQVGGWQVTQSGLLLGPMCLPDVAVPGCTLGAASLS